MSDFFIIQSREPFTDNRTKSDYELVHHLVAAGNNVTMMLVQNGVLPVRRGSITKEFDALCYQHINILVDQFSLRQREIEVSELKAGILVSDIDAAIKAMIAGHKVIWH